MPRIHLNEYDDLDEIDDEFEAFEPRVPIRRDNAPVSDRHANQKRAECGINRYRKNKPNKGE